jgi:hypothetical protein
MYRIHIIPTFTDTYARWKQYVDLSKVRYGLYFAWNTRVRTWHLTVTDMNDTPILAGVRLVPEIDLLKKYKAAAPELPPGILRVLDRELDPKTAELDRRNLGTRFVLSYTDFGE